MMLCNLSDNFTDNETIPNDALVNLLNRINIIILGHGIHRHHFNKHQFEFVLNSFLIICINQGDAVIFHNEQKISLKIGSIFMLLPGETYSIYTKAGRNLTYSFIYFDMLPITIRNMLKKHAFVAGKDIYKRNSYHTFYPQITLMCKSIYKRKPGHNSLLKNAINSFITCILHEKVPPISAINYASTMKEGNLVDLSYNYTIENLNSPISIIHLAQALGTSTSTLKRVFKNVLGLSPTKALASFKILISLDMLRNGTAIKKIAKDLGYTSASHYSRTFKGIMGKVPTQYMKENQKKTHI